MSIISITQIIDNLVADYCSLALRCWHYMSSKGQGCMDDITVLCSECSQLFGEHSLGQFNSFSRDALPAWCGAYHWYYQSLGYANELDLEEVKAVTVQIGFDIKNEHRVDMTYVNNKDSMLGYVYHAAFWTATKRL
ncbi:hypothetical protein V8E53_005694 [Lactarius tabidus]